jgi:hypothetical protein
MLTGRVKKFIRTDNKNFGFIAPEDTRENDDSQNVFFHFRQGHHFVIVKNSIQFERNSHLQRFPRLDEKVVYEMNIGPQGPRATGWGYESDFKEAQRLLKASTRTPIWRIVHADRVPDTLDEWKPRVVWEGENLLSRGLEKFYNPIDELLPQKNGRSNTRRYWLVSLDGGKTWSISKCPKEYEGQFDRAGERKLD